MKAKRKKKFRTPANSSDNRIFRRFRLINILIFILAFGVMELLMTPAFVGVMNRVTAEYAERYAASSADALSSHIAKELSLMSRTAHSNALTEWMRDEYNEEKKTRAFSEMAGVVGELYSFNLYVGIKSSLNEYSVGPTDRQVASFDKNEPTDRWFFDCIESDRDYLLSVDRDHLLERKRMWIDYKVISDGEVLGVICTGLEFSHVAGELFSHYDSNDLRGIIIDDRGMVQMDSNLMNDREFLHETYEIPLESVVSDESLILAVRDYLSRTEGYTERLAHPEVVNLSSGYYRYLTITPIRHTNWSVLILSGLTSPFKMSYFIPVTTVALLLLIAFAVTSSAVNYRLIFSPLRKLNQSLELMAENPYQIIYGTDRDDELGSLSKTIHSLFTQANIDALTGIYNRRFMEHNLERTMGFLARSNGLLSVLMLDVDFFKKYNDTYGHEQGDECLKAIAGVISSGAAREVDFAARYGGEEFIAVLPNTDASGAMLVANRLCNDLRALAIPHESSGISPFVTISAGVTTGRVKYGQRWEEYVARADEALYLSKNNGRDRCTFLELDNNKEQA